MKLNRTLISGLILFAVLVSVLHGQVTGDTVGDLENPQSLQFSGMSYFSEKDVRNTLFSDPLFVSHSSRWEPLSAYCTYIQNTVLRGYYASGFLNAEITATPGPGIITVYCREGFRYILKDISVTGGSKTQNESLHKALTTPLARIQSRNNSNTTQSVHPFFTIGNPIGNPGQVVWKIRETLDFLGYRETRFTHIIQKNDGDKSAMILITLEGSQDLTVIDSVIPPSAARSKQKDILNLLAPFKGKPATGTTLNEVENLLVSSGRFMKVWASYHEDKNQTGKGTLKVTGTENTEAPPFSNPLHRYDKSILKTSSFLKNISTSGFDTTVNIISKNRNIPFSIESISSPTHGTCISVEMYKDTGKQLKLLYISSKEFSGFVNPDKKKVWTHEQMPFSLNTRFGAWINPGAKYRDFHIALKTFVNLTSDTPGIITVQPVIEQGAAIKLLRHKRIERTDEKGNMVLTSKDTAFKLNAVSELATGIPQHVIFEKDSTSVSITFEKNVWADRCRPMITQALTYEDLNTPETPVSSLFSFFNEFTPAPLRGILAAETRPILSRLDGLANDSQEDKPRFILPEKGINAYLKQHDSLQYLGSRILGTIIAQTGNNRISWPSRIPKILAFRIGRMRAPMIKSLEQIYYDETTGPIGYLTAAHLARLSDIEKPAIGLAKKGYETLSLKVYKAEWDKLFGAETILNKPLIGFLKKASELPEKDKDRFAELFPAEWSVAVYDTLLLMEHEPGKPIEDKISLIQHILYKHAFREFFTNRFLEFKPPSGRELLKRSVQPRKQ